MPLNDQLTFMSSRPLLIRAVSPGWCPTLLRTASTHTAAVRRPSRDGRGAWCHVLLGLVLDVAGRSVGFALACAFAFVDIP